MQHANYLDPFLVVYYISLVLFLIINGSLSVKLLLRKEKVAQEKSIPKIYPILEVAARKVFGFVFPLLYAFTNYLE